MIIWYVSAALAGCLLGFLFFKIYSRIIQVGVSRNYFIALGKDIYGLLRGDESEFWKYYFQILSQSLRFAGVQIAGVALGIAPIVLFMMFAMGPIQKRWHAGAPVGVFPDSAATVVDPGVGNAYDRSSDDGFNDVSPVALLLESGELVSIQKPWAVSALCMDGDVFCSFLKINGYTVIGVPLHALGDHNLIIVRPVKGNRNPLWPYFSDLDFIFLAGLIVINLFLIVFHRKEAADTSAAYAMSFVDYILTWVATHNTGVMNKLGDWETRLFGRKISDTPIEKPIFVSGLARSGTTIVLELFAKAEAVATHRYKDFPFMMTPLLWNGFTRIASSKQTPIERPHNDRIQITRESPDAFEEPIWQYYFPRLHDPKTIHIITPADHYPAFAKFYTEHIRKILLIRKGRRYVSKGNYNLTRFKYLRTIFPDARFLVPIRHPLFHVESLVRQHNLFVGYSINNQQVAEYLKAVGHYEFGPQRIPVVLSEGSASRIMEAWRRGCDSLGYAIQWAEIYEYILDLFSLDNMSENLCVLRFEDLCRSPRDEFERIVDFVALKGLIDVETAAKAISPPSRALGLSQTEREECWSAVEPVARRYGYTEDPGELLDFPDPATEKARDSIS